MGRRKEGVQRKEWEGRHVGKGRKMEEAGGKRELNGEGRKEVKEYRRVERGSNRKKE